MGQAESNESAAVKRQAEGGAVPMYQLLDLSGKLVSKKLINKGNRIREIFHLQNKGIFTVRGNFLESF